MDAYASLALDVEETGTKILSALNAIRNDRNAREAKSLLLTLMATANLALQDRCHEDNPFPTSKHPDFCRRCAEDALNAMGGSGSASV